MANMGGRLLSKITCGVGLRMNGPLCSAGRRGPSCPFGNFYCFSMGWVILSGIFSYLTNANSLGLIRLSKIVGGGWLGGLTFTCLFPMRIFVPLYCLLLCI